MYSRLHDNPEKAEFGLTESGACAINEWVRGHFLYTGEGHNLQEHSVVLIRGGRVKDLPESVTTSFEERLTHGSGKKKTKPLEIRRKGG